MLSQDEADTYIRMPKTLRNALDVQLPATGEGLEFLAVSADARDEFVFSVSRGRISMNKISYQNRHARLCPLVRLELNSRPHQNPDGAIIGGDHLHVYREHYAMKWAFPVPDDFTKIEDLVQTLVDFLDYCNITNLDKVSIRQELMS